MKLVDGETHFAALINAVSNAETPQEATEAKHELAQAIDALIAERDRLRAQIEAAS